MEQDHNILIQCNALTAEMIKIISSNPSTIADSQREENFDKITQLLAQRGELMKEITPEDRNAPFYHELLENNAVLMKLINQERDYLKSTVINLNTTQKVHARYLSKKRI